MDAKVDHKMDEKSINGMEKEQDQLPPPPYLEEGETSAQGFPPHPPQPHHTQVPSRTLQVEYSGWKWKKLQITDSDLASVLYTADLKFRKPHMRFKSKETEAEFGTVILRSMTPTVEISLHGQALNLSVGWKLSTDVTYTSLMLPNTRFRWKSKSNWKMFDLVCWDEEDAVPVAQFVSSCWSFKKAGKIELFGPKVSEGAVVDEILVVGLALVHYAVCCTAAIAA